MGHNEISAKRKLIALSASKIKKKLERAYTSNLTAHLNNSLDQKQTKKNQKNKNKNKKTKTANTQQRDSNLKRRSQNITICRL